jgi:hypothetical protein
MSEVLIHNLKPVHLLALGLGRPPTIPAGPVACLILEALARACVLLRDLDILRFPRIVRLRTTNLGTTEEGLE